MRGFRAASDSNARPAIVIVQGVATQFDGPFYRFLHTQGRFDLTICYTEPDSALHPYDSELSRHPDWDNDVQSGYRYRIYPAGLLRRLMTSVSIVAARPRLIILSGWRSFDCLTILALALVSGIRLGLRSDNCLSDHGGRISKSRWRRFVLRRLLTFFDTGHPVGTRAAEYLKENGFNPARIFLFPYLVDHELLLSRHESVRHRRASLRAEYGIGEKDFVVLGVMKFVDREDPLILLKAAISLIKGDAVQGADFVSHLILVGDGPLRAEIDNHTPADLHDRFHFPGYVSYSSLPGFFAMADVLVHPARQESWGVTVNEALLCGLPVIAADSVGASADLIQSGVNGYTFSAGDCQKLTELLSAMRDNPDLRANLTAGCRTADCMKLFTYSATEENLANAMLSPPPNRAPQPL